MLTIQQPRGGYLGGGKVQGVQSVPRNAWVKTDAASRRVSTDVVFAVLLAASVFTYALQGTFCSASTLPPLGPHLCSNHSETLTIFRTMRWSLDAAAAIAANAARTNGEDWCWKWTRSNDPQWAPVDVSYCLYFFKYRIVQPRRVVLVFRLISSVIRILLFIFGWLLRMSTIWTTRLSSVRLRCFFSHQHILLYKERSRSYPFTFLSLSLSLGCIWWYSRRSSDSNEGIKGFHCPKCDQWLSGGITLK